MPKVYWQRLKKGFTLADQGTQGWLSPWLRQQRVSAASPLLQGRVLDYGCGSGELGRLVAKASYLGYDRDSTTVAVAQRTHPEHTFVARSPSASHDFDTVVCLAVLEHVADPASFLRLLATYLAPDGTLVITTPHPRYEWIHTTGARIGLFSHDAEEEHETLLDKTSLVRAAREAGLETTSYKRFLFGANQLATFTRAGG